MTHQAFAETAMLIRKPVEQVYEAFINPEITTKFWFTGSTGRLDENSEVTWTWEMYDVHTKVTVKKLELYKCIEIEWGNNNAVTRVKWTFTNIKEGTFVNIVNDGFAGNTDEIMKQVRDATGGFTWVLAGLKAYLEYDIELNLVHDRFPTGKLIIINVNYKYDTRTICNRAYLQCSCRARMEGHHQQRPDEAMVL